MGLMVATKAFFKLLFNRELGQSFEKLLDGQTGSTNIEAPKPEPESPRSPKPPKVPAPPKPTRSEALSLLAALQREARFLDLVSEPLGDFSDEQIGAAAREVLEESGKVIQRMFALKPLTECEPGDDLKTPDEFDPSMFRLTGNVFGEPPYDGVVGHSGWIATKCAVPKWSGDESAAMIVTPIHLELG